MKRIIATAASAAILAACTAYTSVLDNAKLVITELNGTEYVSQTETPASMSFDGKIVSANLGGNAINADYKESKDGKIALTMGRSTKMMVPEELREDEFVEAFNSICAFSVDGNEYSFMNEAGTVVIRCQSAE